jgi:hypothetical protein
MGPGGGAGPSPCDHQAARNGAGYQGTPPGGPGTPQGPLQRPEPSEPCFTRECVTTQICYRTERTREGGAEVWCDPPVLHCELVPGWCRTGAGEVGASESACGQMTRADECEFGSVCCYDHILFPPIMVPTCESTGRYPEKGLCETTTGAPCLQVILQNSDCAPDICPPRTCWQSRAPAQSTRSCGEMGGDYCSQGGSVPSGYESLGVTWDCNPCLKVSACQSTGCPKGSCGWQTDNCGSRIWCGDCLPSCGAMGGDYCSLNATCPAGYQRLGTSSDCAASCRRGPSCGAIGGNYCSQGGSIPRGYESLGVTWDCNPCLKVSACQSTGCPNGSCGWQTDNCGSRIWCGDCMPSCGAMGGDYCSQSNSCPRGYESLGASSDCRACCTQGPSCGALGGDYCSQGGAVPAGYEYLGVTWDCNPCLRTAE